MDVRAVVVGFVAAIAVTAGLVYVVGVNDVITALGRADPQRILLVAAAAIVWLTSWALSLRTVLGVLGQHLSVPRAIAVYASTTFANNVTPFGQAGGEPFSAYLISNETDIEYDTGFAAISSVDAIHFVPSLTLGVLGIGYVGATAALTRRLTMVAGVVGVLAVGLPIAAYFGWRNRERVEAGVARVVTPIVHAVGRVVPQFDAPDASGIEERVDRFFVAIDRVAADRRGLAVAVGYSALGWLALVASLWSSLFALGYVVPLSVVLVAIPVGDLAAAAPLPGGLGGVEALYVLVLATLTPVSAGAVAAAVLVHRGATYLFPIVLGGAVAAVIATD
ncbi:lysylphosphatidylglycerol synthase transmembrane domain-containing protein [Halobacterium zhouii]|uniref:lysylphosphatidylglycerol synthase transmembrane domain-containing protein n=1 Tax=Halobacterium zhouii TaxID=2902624 RepID=UPI001E49A405|nr:lysylphosphatidylglycerol synthase transmembrane domain-containing protein [Halobacterium zhouii]